MNAWIGLLLDLFFFYKSNKFWTLKYSIFERTYISSRQFLISVHHDRKRWNFLTFFCVQKLFCKYVERRVSVVLNKTEF